MYACVYDILKNYYSIRQGALLNRGASIEAVKEYNLNCFGFFFAEFQHIFFNLLSFGQE